MWDGNTLTTNGSSGCQGWGSGWLKPNHLGKGGSVEVVEVWRYKFLQMREWQVV
jgi:hypothetical protein